MVKIRQVCDGVFANDDTAPGPVTVAHQGIQLRRFMDRYYLRDAPAALSQIEVTELCRERLKHPENILSPNQHVRALFRSFILDRRPDSFLEIGAGNNPILESGALSGYPARKYTVDADPVHGSTVFSGSSAVLPYADASIEMAAAVFVLQFHFYPDQIVELHRCMTSGAVFVANVYNRDESSRNDLQAAFQGRGFCVERLNDPRTLCKNHEYWIVGKCERNAVESRERLRWLAEGQDLT